MNKVISINLGGYILTLDEPAYHLLKDYLDKLRVHYLNEKDGAEIINDIEIAISEILLSNTKKNIGSISLDEVKEAIKRMGEPDEIFNQDSENRSENTYKKPRQEKPNGKRIFRDTDNSVIGGVCAGLSNYFGVDVVFFRIALIILFFFGPGLIIYIILWAVVPKANTLSEKAQMRGEELNLDSITANIKSEFENLGKDWKEDKGGRKTKVTQTINKSVGLFAQLLELTIKFFVYITIFVLSVTLIALIIALFITMLNINAYVVAPPYIDEVWVLYLMLSSIGLMLIIPMLAIIIKGIRFMSGNKHKSKWEPIAFATLSFIGLFGLIYSLTDFGLNFKANTTKKESITLQSSSNLDSLNIALLEDNTEIQNWQGLREPYFSGFTNTDSLQKYDNVQVDIKPSYDSLYHITVHSSTFGKDTKMANYLLSQINPYAYTLIGNRLSISRFTTFPLHLPFKGQHSNATLLIPVGKTIYLEKSMKDALQDVKNKQNIWDEDMAGYYWKMDKEELTLNDASFPDYQENETTVRRFNFRNGKLRFEKKKIETINKEEKSSDF